MQEFGENASEFDGMGDYISIPDTDVDFNMNGWQYFEIYCWARDGKTHVEVKITPSNKARSGRFAAWWQAFLSRFGLRR